MADALTEPIECGYSLKLQEADFKLLRSNTKTAEHPNIEVMKSENFLKVLKQYPIIPVE